MSRLPVPAELAHQRDILFRVLVTKGISKARVADDWSKILVDEDARRRSEMDLYWNKKLNKEHRGIIAAWLRGRPK